MLTPQNKLLLKILTLLCALGIGLTGYLTFQHFKNPGSSFCNINEYVSCDIVNKSIYAEVFGIPVAVAGLVAYLIMFEVCVMMFRGKLNMKKSLTFCTLFSGVGVLFSLYLTFVELFVLNAICIFCVTHQINILIIFLLFLTLWQRTRKSLLASL